MLAVQIGCSAPEDLPARQWKLPDALEEISGLAFDEAGDLIAHDDEIGLIYKLDFTSGRIIDQLPLTEPVPEGDFEGIASTPAGIWMITSHGMLHQGAQTYDLGTRDDCEIEGLTFDGEWLAAVCKRIYDGDRQRVRIHFVDPEDLTVQRVVDVPVPWPVRPSAIAWDAFNRRYLVLTTSPSSVIAIDTSLQIVDVLALNPNLHKQPEGIEVIGHQFLIADEARGGRARLTIYDDLL